MTPADKLRTIMRSKLTFAFALIAIVVIGAPTRAQPEKKATKTKTAIERGLSFLKEDALKWRKERECATCHHGTMTVWAMNEAKAQGYSIAAEDLADMTKWTKERLKDIGKPRDTRPGWSMVNSPALMLATMAQAILNQTSFTADELKAISGHLLRHQEADGSWAWSSAPAKNRPPPFFESDEVATLLGAMALVPHVPIDPKAKSPEREARAKSVAWLAKQQPTNTTQAAAYRLLFKVRAGEKSLEADIADFLRRQNKDGGWSQVKDRPSDAYATGQALYMLSLAGVKKDRAEMQRGVEYLLAGQKEDGSWPMTRRGHPGVTPGTFTVPIVYFGSTWATLGLMRAAPYEFKHTALHAGSQLIRGDSGKWNDEARLLHVPPLGEKPAKLSLDAWTDQLLKKKHETTGQDEQWLIFRTEQLDDNDRIWIERIERRGKEITVFANLAKWQGKYFRNFTYYQVIAVTLGKLEPGQYEAKWIMQPLEFTKFDGDGKAVDANFPKDERRVEKKPTELRVSFSVGRK